MPVRLGGMGIDNPVLTSDFEYAASTTITETLANIIYRQENNFDNYDNWDNDIEKVTTIQLWQ